MAVTIMNTRNWRCEAQHIMMGERVKKEKILCVCAGHYFRKIKFYQEIVSMLISHKKVEILEIYTPQKFIECWCVWIAENVA